MTQLNIWSPYNLVGMRPPHLGKFLKPGTVLTYDEDPADTLFWAWDLENGGLAEGIGKLNCKPGLVVGGLAGLAISVAIHFLVDMTNKFSLKGPTGSALDQAAHIMTLLVIWWLP